MDRSDRAITVRAVIATVAAAFLAGCGDPFVVVGDPPGIVRIVAGRPEESGDSLTGLATDSHLWAPHGIATAPDGTFHIADYENSRILAVNSAGQIEALVDHRTRREEPRLHEPDGLDLDGMGGLLIADPGAQRVWRLDLATRALETIAGTGVRGLGLGPDTANALQADLRDPTGVAVATDGRIYFTEFGSHRVRRIEADGVLVTFAGTGSPGFGGDGGPAIDASMKRPAGLTISGDVLYIADSDNQRIRAIDLNTSLIRTVAGSGGTGFAGDDGAATDALLDGPHAVATTEDGRTLFIADSNNHRIRMVNLDTGTIGTFAGTGDRDFGGDLLPAGRTTLDTPMGVAVSPFNLLFISSTFHHTVLRAAIGLLTGPS
jgi:sugar lactone lactonase YvrE